MAGDVAIAGGKKDGLQGLFTDLLRLETGPLVMVSAAAEARGVQIRLGLTQPPLGLLDIGATTLHAHLVTSSWGRLSVSPFKCTRLVPLRYFRFPARVISATEVPSSAPQRA